ncbi:MAG: helix-turn-helix domain-containing protein [Sedimentisphaerales bacterium]|nr:helix-turn-helix domain-containing protein [Sedimentisphaerales bacterium]
MLDLHLLQTLKLSVINIDFCQLDRSWHYSNVRGPFSRLYLITGGEGYVYHHNQKYHLKPGKMHLIPGFTLGSYHCDDYLEQYYIHFSNEMDGWLEIFVEQQCDYHIDAIDLDYMLFKRLLELNPAKALLETDPEKYDRKKHLIRSQQPEGYSSAADYLESIGILKQLLARFFRGKIKPSDDEKTQQLRRFRNVIRYINDNLHEIISVEYLSHIACLNSDYFSKLFKKVMGVAPIEYVNRKRIEKVQLLLVTTNYNLDKIALEAGYRNLSYFSRQFKKYSGMTPGKYRRVNFGPLAPLAQKSSPS